MTFSEIFNKIKIQKHLIRIKRKAKAKFYEGSLFKLDPSAKIILKNGNLKFGNDRLAKTDSCSRLVMEKDAKLVTEGNFTFTYGADILIKENSTLVLGEGWANFGCQIRCGNKIVIGNGVTFGRNVLILDSDFHCIKDENGEVINPAEPVYIGDNVWLGHNVTVLKGVTIGEGAVCAAQSVVTRDVPPHSIVAGNPAKVIKENITWERPTVLNMPKLGAKCNGCGACEKICPVNAIEMIKDEFGFEYSYINKDKCINCGKCLKVCPELNKPQTTNKIKPEVFAAWSKDINIRLTSTSGGIFSELAKTFIQNGGYVCGAVYNDELLVEHIVTNNIDDIERLKQSKYIQSNLKNVYPEIKTLLDSDKKVMFVGTPCQNTGLINFLGKKYDKLYLVDFICLGVNSPEAYKKYLNFLEQKYNSKVKKVWFKNKDFGWNNFHTKIEFENGESYFGSRNDDLFMKGFIGQKSLYLRESCYNCSHRTFPRYADITLADFWGVKKSLDNGQGTSLVLINSSKGRQLFKTVTGEIKSFPRPLKSIFKGNFALYVSKTKPYEYLQIKNDLKQMDFDKFIEKYIP